MKKRQTKLLVLAMIVAFFSAELFMPESTMASPAPVEKTGQTTSYRTGDDGDEQAGVSWPNPRFTDNSDGTVTDNLTGLIWLKQANYNSTGGGTGTATWNDAVDFCKALANGMCGLTDGSVAGDWRLPNIKELQSLIHFRYSNPAVPNTAGIGQWIANDPFTFLQSAYYWSSTTFGAVTDEAWAMHMGIGAVLDGGKTSTLYVWPVRGDSVPDAPVRAVSEWGLIILFILLVGSALWVMRRRAHKIST